MRLHEHFETVDQAWSRARAIVDAVDDGLSAALGLLTTLSEYRMPAPEARRRDFQVLHMDFGLPLGRPGRADVARYTVLYVSAQAQRSGATTRIVRLDDLAKQRTWPTSSLIAQRLRTRHDRDTSEGVLARIVEAADETTELANKNSAGFLCGLEFDSLRAEQRYMRHHGIDLSAVEHRIELQPGRALIFDNLACVHGRAGQRATNELHQLCLGFTDLPATDQRLVLDYALNELTVDRRSERQAADTSIA